MQLHLLYTSQFTLWKGSSNFSNSSLFPPGFGLPTPLHGLQQLHLQQPSQPGLPTQDQVPVLGEHRKDGLGHMSPQRSIRPPSPTHRLTHQRPTHRQHRTPNSPTLPFLNIVPSLPRELHLLPTTPSQRRFVPLYPPALCLSVLPQWGRNTR